MDEFNALTNWLTANGHTLRLLSSLFYLFQMSLLGTVIYSPSDYFQSVRAGLVSPEARTRVALSPHGTERAPVLAQDLGTSLGGMKLDETGQLHGQGGTGQVANSPAVWVRSLYC